MSLGLSGYLLPEVQAKYRYKCQFGFKDDVKMIQHAKYRYKGINVLCWDDFSGRILIDLKDGNFQVLKLIIHLLTHYISHLNYKKIEMQAKNFEFDLKKMIASDNPITFSSVESLLPLLADFCTHREIDCIQLFDLNLLLSNSAYDENTVFEVLTEKWHEVTKYDKVMVVVDAKGLIGVGQHDSESSMGESKSYSITNQRIWGFILEMARAAEVHTYGI
jgi:hypothetical protein